MIPYSLNVAVILAVCLGFYRLFLQKETYYSMNRAVLLICLALAFILPLVPVPGRFSPWKEPVRATEAELPIVHLSTADETGPVVTKAPEPLDPVAGTAYAEAPLGPRLARVIWIYWCGVVISGANLLLQLIVVIYRAYRKQAIQDGIYRIVELDSDQAPHSFGTTIFINPTKYDWETYNQIITHEKAHIRQGHSLDLVLAELALVSQWFNPFAWLYRRQVESNLEFLADDTVLKYNSTEQEAYQLSLLRVAVPNWPMKITTNYNQSLLKKRMLMMNARRSNIHILWKYFMVAPLMVALLCGFARPVKEIDGPITEKQLSSALADNRNVDQSKGLWFADIKDDKVRIEFKSDDDDHKWSSNATFSKSELPELPRAKKAGFQVTREQGTVDFNGKFDGDQGYGRYKFKVNKMYKELMSNQNLRMDNEDYFSFFMLDIKKEYVKSLRDNGFTNLGKSQVLSMAAFNVDGAYISYWRKNGYASISAANLVSLKSLKIDTAYANDIRRAGYNDLTVQQLISFKSQGVTGDYINGLRKASLKNPASARVEEKPSPTEIVRSKSMNIDSNYVAGMRDAGYANLNSAELGRLKSQGVGPEYMQTFADAGLNIPASSLASLKAQGITAAFIKSFYEIGLTDLPLNSYASLKSRGITAAFIKSYQEIGLTDLPLNTLYSLKERALTPAYIKSFQDIGIKDIPFNTLYTLREQGLTPAYIKNFYDKGLSDYSFSTLNSFKTQGISADFVKGFQDLGYFNIPVSQLNSLKTNGITAEAVRAFHKLGFTNILLSQMVTLKTNGITAGFVADMKQKGFESKDLEKYIQLKSFNTGGSKIRSSF